VRRSNQVLRVSVRVVNANTGFNLWAERYDRSAREIFALQDDITKHVVAALKLKLTTAEKKLVGKRTTANPAAYDLILRARAARRRITPKSNDEAGKLFEQAIALDPNYAQAYAELGAVYAFKWIFSGARDRTILDRGIAEVRKALEIDPALPSAYAELAWLYLWRREHAVAIGLLERALELDAGHSRSLVTLGFAHLMAGDPAKGLTYIQRARERMTIEPYYFGFWAAECYFYLNRREDAVRELKRSLAFNPRMFYAHRFLAVVYVEMGRMEEARAAIKEARRLNPRISISFLERQLPFKNREDVERQLRALRKLGFPE
jgi:adenylate cyclase